MTKWSRVAALLISFFVQQAATSPLSALQRPAGPQTVLPSPSAQQLVSRVLDALETRGFRGTARLVRTDARAGTTEIRRLTTKARFDGSVRTMLYQAARTPTAGPIALLVETRRGQTPTGFVADPSGVVASLTSLTLGQPFLGSDLMIGDLTDDFLSWPAHRIVGEEVVLRRRCVVIESRASATTPAAHSIVRSWVSPDLALPLRIEKLDKDGHLLRRLTVERVARLDERRWAPTRLVVTGNGGSTTTTLESIRGERNVEVPAAEFERASIIRSLQRSK